MLFLLLSSLFQFSRCEGFSIIKFLTTGYGLSEASTAFSFLNQRQLQLLMTFGESTSIHDLLNVNKNITEQMNRLTIFLSSFRTVYQAEMIANIPAIFYTFQNFFVFMGMNTTVVYDSMMKVKAGMSIFDGFAENGLNFTTFLEVFDALNLVLSDSSYTFADLHNDLGITDLTTFNALKDVINTAFSPANAENIGINFAVELGEKLKEYMTVLMLSATMKLAPIMPLALQMINLTQTPLEVRYTNFKIFYQSFALNPLAVIFPPPLVSFLASLNSQFDNIISGTLSLDNFLFDMIGVPPEDTRLLMDLISMLVEPKSIFEILVKTAETLNVDEEIASYSPIFIMLEEIVRFLNTDDYKLYDLFYPVANMFNSLIDQINISYIDQFKLDTEEEKFNEMMDDLGSSKTNEDWSNNTKTLTTIISMSSGISKSLINLTTNNGLNISEEIGKINTYVSNFLSINIPSDILDLLKISISGDSKVETILSTYFPGIYSLIKATMEVLGYIYQADDKATFAAILGSIESSYIDYSKVLGALKPSSEQVLGEVLSSAIKDGLSATKIKNMLEGIVQTVKDDKTFTKGNILTESSEEFILLYNLLFKLSDLIIFNDTEYSQTNFSLIARKLRTNSYLSLYDLQLSSADTATITLNKPISGMFIYGNTELNDHTDVRARVLSYNGYPLLFNNVKITNGFITGEHLIVNGSLTLTGDSILSAYNKSDSINFNAATLNIECERSSIPTINLVSSATVPSAININVNVEGLNTTIISQLYSTAKPIIYGVFDCKTWLKRANVNITGSRTTPLILKCQKESSGVTIPGNNKQMLVIRTSTSADVEDNKESSLSGGSIAGIVIGAVVIFVIIVTFIVAASIKKKNH